MKKLLIGMPTYDGNVDFIVQANVYRETQGYVNRFVASQQSSLLANCCNQLYTLALNHREEYGWFMLWHADVRIKEPGLINGLLGEMERTGAQCISVLLPIKDEKGLTSTGLYFTERGKKRRRRLTMREAAKLPETFSAADLVGFWQAPVDSVLLVNTGLLLFRLEQPWVEQVYFNIRDRIIRQDDGSFLAVVDPEDWNFSRQLHELKVPVVCTRKFSAYHKGVGLYSNQGEWGRWQTDELWQEVQLP